MYLGLIEGQEKGYLSLLNRLGRWKEMNLLEAAPDGGTLTTHMLRSSSLKGLGHY